MKVRVQVKVTDRGLKKFVTEVIKKGALTEVGVLGPKAAAVHGSGKVTVGEIANFHEFGTSRVPRRSFIGAWFDDNLNANKELARKLAKQRLQGKLTYDQTLKMLGVHAVGGIQKRISQGIPPPNAPSTIRRKGSSKPLIDTGQLRSSISYRIVK